MTEKEKRQAYERALTRIWDLSEDFDQSGLIEKMGRIAKNTLASCGYEPAVMAADNSAGDA